MALILVAYISKTACLTDTPVANLLNSSRGLQLQLLVYQIKPYYPLVRLYYLIIMTTFCNITRKRGL